MAPDIAPVDPLELDLETADAMAEVDRASMDAAGLRLPAPVGAATLRAIQLGSDCRPVGGLWLARDGDRVVGHARVEMPWRENTGTVFVRGTVHPDHRRRGIGRALLRHALDAAERAGRPTVFAGSYEGTDGVTALAALGFGHAARYAIRRVEPHEANDAPRDDAGLEDDARDAARLSDYERAMAGRHQTVYRVMARHRRSGEWAGLSLLCVDEFQPTVAFQEETSVVREHRGHRLGLLMKTELLRWITRERPEVGATDTWNETTNHHMIAVNERLGANVLATYAVHRLDR